MKASIFDFTFHLAFLCFLVTSSYVFISILMTHFNFGQRFEVIVFWKLYWSCVILALMRLIQDGLTHHQTNNNLLGKTKKVTTKKGIKVFDLKQGNYPFIEEIESCMVIPFTSLPLAYVNALAWL